MTVTFVILQYILNPKIILPMSARLKAEKLIKNYFITSPKELNLEEIANAENLIVEEETLNSHLGRITYGDGYGLIKISTAIESTGAKRFTLAHEMGHFYNEKLRMKNLSNPLTDYKLMECSESDILSFKSVRQKENEANEFAAELLMYKPWFSEYIKDREISMDLIKEIAEYFNVSLTAAAIRYSEIGKYPVSVISSKDGKVKWSAVSEYFPIRFIPKGYLIRKESIAYDYFNNNEVQSKYDMVPAHTWFSEDYKCPEDMYFYEHSVVMKNYNSVLTLLWEYKN